MVRRPSLLVASGISIVLAGIVIAATGRDRPLMEVLYARPLWMLAFMRYATYLGSLWVLIPASIAGIIFALHHHGRDLAVRLGIGMAAAEALTELIKFILARSRPDVLHQVTARGSSFPSGHSLNSMVVWSLLALVIASVGRRRKIPARILFIIPLLVGWTRTYLGVHWPSDVLGGWGIGMILLAVIAGPKRITPRSAL